MRFFKFLLSPLLLASTVFASASAQANAQATPGRIYGLEPGGVSKVDLGVNYNFVHANAPPSVCGCFSLQGASGVIVVNFADGISFVGDFYIARANNVDGTAQNITLTNFLAGPRFSYRTTHPLTPYAQLFIGAAHERSNYAFVHSATDLALGAGLGLNWRISRHLQWNALEADLIYSQNSNGSTNYQNDLRVATGLSFRFGPR